jgi:Mycoplasma protein of unknown function, DUF285
MDCGNYSINAPTASPTPTSPINVTNTSFVPIRNREDLLLAVDEYLNSSGSAQSEVALRHGYPIGTWDVSRVTNFSAIFSADRNTLATYFEDDLSGWDTSSAVAMDRMFSGAVRFTGDSIASWSTDRVVSMNGMCTLLLLLLLCVCVRSVGSSCLRKVKCHSDLVLLWLRTTHN